MNVGDPSKGPHRRAALGTEPQEAEGRMRRRRQSAKAERPEVREPTPLKTEAIKTTRDQKCWRGHGEKGTPVHCWWDRKWVHLVWRVLKKLQLPMTQQTHLWVYIQRKGKQEVRESCSLGFTAAAFRTPGCGNHLSVCQPRRIMWDTYTQWSIN